MYSVKDTDRGCEIYGVRDFVPEHIFECGQCFRWNRNEKGNYCGVVRGKYAEIHFKNDTLTIIGADSDDFEFWYHYFDLGRDYGKIKEELALKDDYMSRAVAFGHGIRILNQDPFEALISFIISANNNIPRIKKCIERLCGQYGSVIKDGIYAFPTPGQLAGVCEEDISTYTGAGYRCGYINGTASSFHLSPFNKDSFSNISIDEARAFMRQYKGVGPKVADCILLFTGIYQNAFPVDVWVKRVMDSLYHVNTYKQIDLFAKSYFGSLSGFAQQYLFYAIREGFLKVI